MPGRIPRRMFAVARAAGLRMWESRWRFPTMAMFWCVRAVSCASQALNPDDCLVLCCITALAPCTNSLRRYWSPCWGIPALSGEDMSEG